MKLMMIVMFEHDSLDSYLNGCLDLAESR